MIHLNDIGIKYILDRILNKENINKSFLYLNDKENILVQDLLDEDNNIVSINNVAYQGIDNDNNVCSIKINININNLKEDLHILHLQEESVEFEDISNSIEEIELIYNYIIPIYFNKELIHNRLFQKKDNENNIIAYIGTGKYNKDLDYIQNEIKNVKSEISYSIENNQIKLNISLTPPGDNTYNITDFGIGYETNDTNKSLIYHSPLEFTLENGRQKKMSLNIELTTIPIIYNQDYKIIN